MKKGEGGGERSKQDTRTNRACVVTRERAVNPRGGGLPACMFAWVCQAGMLDAADALEDSLDTWRQSYPEAVAGVEAVMGKRRARRDEEEEKRREAGDGGEDSASVFSAVTGLTDGSVRTSLSSASGVSSASSLGSSLSLITMESKPLSQLRRRKKEEKKEKQRRTKSERRRPSLKEEEDALRAELAAMLPTKAWLEEVGRGVAYDAPPSHQRGWAVWPRRNVHLLLKMISARLPTAAWMRSHLLLLGSFRHAGQAMVGGWLMTWPCGG